MDLGYTAEHVSLLSFTGPQSVLSTQEQIHEAGKQVMARLSGEYDVVLVARADGGLAADVRPLVHLSVTAIVPLPEC